MTFETAMSALEGLGGKDSGQLILAEDWNGLIEQVRAMGQALSDGLEALDTKLQGVIDGEIADLRTDLDALQTRVRTLESHVGAPASTDTGTLTGRVAALEGLPEAVDELEQTVEPLREQYLVSLSTEETSYLLGEVAEVTAQVRRLDGSIPDNRPWVDFICTWGTVKAAPGFTHNLGASGRSLSVRSNAQGIARVTVRSEQSGGLSEDEERGLKLFLISQTGSSVESHLKEAPTPMAHETLAAYEEVKQGYDVAAGGALHTLLDSYFQQSFADYGGSWGQVWQPSDEWQEYRSTLLAIAKNDSDPTTPDPGRGTSSIQVRFRDWVGPSIRYYLEDDEAEVAQGHGYIAQALAAQNGGQAMERATGLIAEGMRQEQGYVHRYKVLNAWGKAADQYDTEGLPDHGPEVIDSVKGAVGIQKGMDVLQYAAGGGEDAFKGWMGMGENMQQGVGRVKDQVDTLDGELGGKVTALEGSVQTMGEQMVGMGDNVLNIDARLNSSEAAARQIQVSLNGIEDKVSAIDALDATSVQGNLRQINAELGVIKSHIERS
jgi:hypothetical protein